MGNHQIVGGFWEPCIFWLSYRIEMPATVSKRFSMGIINALSFVLEAYWPQNGARRGALWAFLAKASAKRLGGASRSSLVVLPW